MKKKTPRDRMLSMILSWIGLITFLGCLIYSVSTDSSGGKVSATILAIWFAILTIKHTWIYWKSKT